MSQKVCRTSATESPSNSKDIVISAMSLKQLLSAIIRTEDRMLALNVPKNMPRQVYLHPLRNTLPRDYEVIVVRADAKLSCTHLLRQWADYFCVDGVSQVWWFAEQCQQLAGQERSLILLIDHAQDLPEETAHYLLRLYQSALDEKWPVQIVLAGESDFFQRFEPYAVLSATTVNVIDLQVMTPSSGAVSLNEHKTPETHHSIPTLCDVVDRPSLIKHEAPKPNILAVMIRYVAFISVLCLGVYAKHISLPPVPMTELSAFSRALMSPTPWLNSQNARLCPIADRYSTLCIGRASPVLFDLKKQRAKVLSQHLPMPHQGDVRPVSSGDTSLERRSFYESSPLLRASAVLSLPQRLRLPMSRDTQRTQVMMGLSSLLKAPKTFAPSPVLPTSQTIKRPAEMVSQGEKHAPVMAATVLCASQRGPVCSKESMPSWFKLQLPNKDSEVPLFWSNITLAPIPVMPLVQKKDHKRQVLSLSQSDQYTVVQLLGSSKASAIDRIIHRYPNQHLIRLKVQRDAKNWYILLLGYFESAQQARKAIQNLPEKLRLHKKPWVRSLRSIKNQYKWVLIE